MTMTIRLARVDSRLLHGQVATAWTHHLNPNRILVVSNAVASDALRKTLITQAAPVGVKANVITVEKMLSIYQDPRFDVFQPIVLTETLADMARLVAGGIDLTQLGVNVGNLTYTAGKIVVSTSVAVDAEDIVAAKAIVAAGVPVTVQAIPMDRPQDLLTLAAEKGL